MTQGRSEDLDPVLDELVEQYLVKAPQNWIRLVVWIGRLVDPDGSPALGDIRLNRVITWAGDGDHAAEEGLGAAYTKGFGTTVIFDRVQALLAARGEGDWTQFRLEQDRDGQRRLHLVTDEPRRPELDAATDPYWRQVHDYLQLRRDDLVALVERLRAAGQLPGTPSPSGSPSSKERGPGRYLRRS